jgi:hypothetical protein
MFNPFFPRLFFPKIQVGPGFPDLNIFRSRISRLIVKMVRRYGAARFKRTEGNFDIEGYYGSDGMGPAPAPAPAQNTQDDGCVRRAEYFQLLYLAAACLLKLRFASQLARGRNTAQAWRTKNKNRPGAAELQKDPKARPTFAPIRVSCIPTARR